jgi:hypothetical protein
MEANFDLCIPGSQIAAVKPPDGERKPVDPGRAVAAASDPLVAIPPVDRRRDDGTIYLRPRCAREYPLLGSPTASSQKAARTGFRMSVHQRLVVVAQMRNCWLAISLRSAPHGLPPMADRIPSGD